MLLLSLVGLAGAWDITFHEDDYLFIVMGKDMAEAFRRADINGMEIQWDDEYPQEIDGYMVWKSAATFNEGTLNIDING